MPGARRPNPQGPRRKGNYGDPNYNPGVFEDNRYDNYNNVPKPVPSGMGAPIDRYYALGYNGQTLDRGRDTPAVGSHPNAPKKMILPGNNGPVGGGSPGFQAAVADLSGNPVDPAYDKLLEFIKTSMASRGQETDLNKQILRKQQEDANRQLYDAYLGSRKSSDADSTALGVDPALVSQARDLAMRKNQENSDQSLADNLAWMDKNGAMMQGMLGASAVQYSGEKASKSAEWIAQQQARVAAENLASLQAQLKARGGSGKKGKGGSGSSGSGPVTETATDTQTLKNGGLDKAFYDQLVASGNPEAAALYLNSLNLNEGTPGAKATQAKINDLATSATYTPVPSKQVTSPYLGPSIQNIAGANKAKQSAAQKKLYEAILPGFINGYFGNPSSTKTVKSTAKTKRS